MPPTYIESLDLPSSRFLNTDTVDEFQFRIAVCNRIFLVHGFDRINIYLHILVASPSMEYKAKFICIMNLIFLIA